MFGRSPGVPCHTVLTRCLPHWNGHVAVAFAECVSYVILFLAVAFWTFVGFQADAMSALRKGEPGFCLPIRACQMGALNCGRGRIKWTEHTDITGNDGANQHTTLRDIGNAGERVFTELACAYRPQYVLGHRDER